MTEKPQYEMVIMAYPDDGYSPEELASYVESLWAFHIECQEQYKGKTIRYFFLPQEQVYLLEEAKNGSN